jgi:hypothetical protein
LIRGTTYTVISPELIDLKTVKDELEVGDGEGFSGTNDPLDFCLFSRILMILILILILIWRGLSLIKRITTDFTGMTWI